MNPLPSKLIEDGVNALASLPGIGKKTALRLALHLLQEPQEATDYIATAIAKMRRDIKFCVVCHNVSDEDKCLICSSPRRDRTVLCVVEGFRDVMAVENTRQYNGVFHVLGGVISPLEGVSPEQLNIPSLMARLAEGEIKEVIMAINPTIEGDTTVFYLSRQLQSLPLQVSVLARGIAFGGELEYTDEITLSRSIAERTPYRTQD